MRFAVLVGTFIGFLAICVFLYWSSGPLESVEANKALLAAPSVASKKTTSAVHQKALQVTPRVEVNAPVSQYSANAEAVIDLGPDIDVDDLYAEYSDAEPVDLGPDIDVGQSVTNEHQQYEPPVDLGPDLDVDAFNEAQASYDESTYINLGPDLDVDPMYNDGYGSGETIDIGEDIDIPES